MSIEPNGRRVARPHARLAGVWLASALLGAALVAPTAARAETWGILDVSSRGIDPGDAETYRELMQAELGKQLGSGGLVTLIAGACSDPGCAAQAGQAAGVQYAVMLTLGQLGQKLIATGSVVESATGHPLRNERMMVDRVEDLEAVAIRLSLAFASNQGVEKTAQLGAITAVEQTPPKRREGTAGGSFNILGVLPFGGALADAGGGLGFDFGFWYEAEVFSIEPRIGVRFDPKSDDKSFWLVPIDLGANYIFGLGDFAPFVGGGVGAHWAYERYTDTVTTGAFVQTTNTAEVEDSGWGFGAFARAGVMLFRTYSVRMTLSLEYDITFVTLNDRAYPQTLQFSAGVIF